MLDTILQSLDWNEIVLALITTAGGTVLVWYRKRLATWVTFWHGVLDGLRAIPELRADVKGIRYYVAPNGGGSLMDAVKRMEAHLVVVSEQQDTMVQTMLAENDVDDDVGRFHCNASGENIYVNQLYARWLGIGKAELMGWNYFNFMHPDDVERVRRQWDLCRAEHRTFRGRYRMMAADGEIITVEAIATPVPEQTPVKRWVGAIRKIVNAQDKH